MNTENDLRIMAARAELEQAEEVQTKEQREAHTAQLYAVRAQLREARATPIEV